jgi:DNA-binding transcriptional regulator/RsmH inhibitor MraZ
MLPAAELTCWRSPKPPLVAFKQSTVRGRERFVANFTLLLDSTGRVSITGVFRLVLGPDGLKRRFCDPAANFPAIDAGDKELMRNMEVLTRRPAFSDRERWTVVLYGTTEKAKTDGKGRVVLSEYHKAPGGRK